MFLVIFHHKLLKDLDEIKIRFNKYITYLRQYISNIEFIFIIDECFKSNIIQNDKIKYIFYNDNFNIKELISNNIESLVWYEIILLINLDYYPRRDINKFFYGNQQCITMLGNRDSNLISNYITRFNAHSFIDYLNSETKRITIYSMEYEKVQFTVTSIFNCILSQLYPLEKFNSYNLLNRIFPYSNLDLSEYKRLKSLYRECEDYRNIFKESITLYCYYEKDGYNKNQTNLQHFINHGLNIKDMDYIFIINGYKCSVNIPNKDNIRVIKQDNCLDFEGWYHVLNKIKWYQYKYIFFINCSVLGPLNFDSSDKITEDWFTPFKEKLDSKTVLCSNVITKLESNYPIGDMEVCTSYNFLVDTVIIPELMTCKIFGDIKNNIPSYLNYYNAPFSRKISRLDTILTGEYGITRVTKLFGYDVTCLHPGLNDRGELKMTLFMKNNWIEGDNRVCPPCYYHECMRIIKKEIIYPPFNYNYNKLKCKSKGKCYSDSNYNWRTKKEFYEKFGYSEEIVF